MLYTLNPCTVQTLGNLIYDEDCHNNITDISEARVIEITITKCARDIKRYTVSI